MSLRDILNSAVEAVTDGAAAVWRGVKDAAKWTAKTTRAAAVGTFNAAKATVEFFGRHWGITTAVIFGLVAAAAATAALILFFPGTIAVLSAFTFTLPLFGAIAPLGFLGAMNIFGACALVGGVGAFAGAIGLSALVHAGHAVYEFFNELFTPNNTQYENHVNKAGELYTNKFAGLTELQQHYEAEKEQNRIDDLGDHPLEAVRHGNGRLFHLPTINQFKDLGNEPAPVNDEGDDEEARNGMEL